MENWCGRARAARSSSSSRVLGARSPQYMRTPSRSPFFDAQQRSRRHCCAACVRQVSMSGAQQTIRLLGSLARLRRPVSRFEPGACACGDLASKSLRISYRRIPPPQAPGWRRAPCRRNRRMCRTARRRPPRRCLSREAPTVTSLALALRTGRAGRTRAARWARALPGVPWQCFDASRDLLQWRMTPRYLHALYRTLGELLLVRERWPTRPDRHLQSDQAPPASKMAMSVGLWIKRRVPAARNLFASRGPKRNASIAAVRSVRQRVPLPQAVMRGTNAYPMSTTDGDTTRPASRSQIISPARRPIS